MGSYLEEALGTWGHGSSKGVPFDAGLASRELFPCASFNPRLFPEDAGPYADTSREYERFVGSDFIDVEDIPAGYDFLSGSWKEEVDENPFEASPEELIWREEDRQFMESAYDDEVFDWRYELDQLAPRRSDHEIDTVTVTNQGSSRKNLRSISRSEHLERSERHIARRYSSRGRGYKKNQRIRGDRTSIKHIPLDPPRRSSPMDVMMTID